MRKNFGAKPMCYPIGEKTFIFPDAFKMGFLKMKE